jgi:hypothetical protein
MNTIDVKLTLQVPSTMTVETLQALLADVTYVVGRPLDDIEAYDGCKLIVPDMDYS